LVIRVPTTAEIVTWVYAAGSVLGADRAHATVVPDDHDTEPHTSDPLGSAAVAVGLYAPKFRPEIVTCVPPLGPTFTGAVKLTAGASKLNVYAALVPTVAEIVNWLYVVTSVVATDVAHVTVVPDVHPDVSHPDPDESPAVGEGLYPPKFRPEIVTCVPPLGPAFTGTE
jgi:hypothetical protein